MRVIKFQGVELELFDSIHNLPPHRESRMNYYLLSELGIGHDLQSFDNHLSSLQAAAIEGKPEVVAQEIENIRLNYWTMAIQYNPKHLAWLCLINKIDGELFTDISEDNLIKTGKHLSEVAGNDYVWSEIFEELKKKLPTNWLVTFLGEEVAE